MNDTTTVENQDIDNTSMDQIANEVSDTGEVAFESATLTLNEFEGLLNIDLDDELDGENDIDAPKDVSLDLTHKSGDYLGQVAFDWKKEGAITMISSNVNGQVAYEVSQVNLPIHLTGQLSIEGDKTPRITNKTVFLRLFLAWVDKESGEIKTNDKNITQLYRVASAWYAAKHNEGKQESEWVSAKQAFKALAKLSTIKVIGKVLSTPEDEENEVYIRVPVTEYTEKATYEKKDGKIVKDAAGEPVVLYEARQVNSINFNQYAKMTNASTLMEDLTAAAQ